MVVETHESDVPITLAVAEFPLPEGAFGEPQLL
jgi:hypothetical protein